MSGGVLISFLGNALANSQAVPQVVSAANPFPVTLSGGIGGLSVAGTVADGALALAQFPVTVGGIDTSTGLLHRLSVDATGALKIVGGTGGGNVQGTIANGAAGNPNPVVGGGLAGANAVSFAVDASGRLLVTGSSASGTGIAGNPVPVGGTDGANVRTFSTDASGRQLVVGAAAPAAAVVGNPVAMAGADGGGLVRIPLTDTSSRFLVAGAVAQGAAVAGNPFLAGARAATTNGASAGDGSAIFVRSDKFGRLVNVPFQPRELTTKSPVITLTTTAETQLLAAGGAGVFDDMVGIKLINTSATPVRCDVRDVLAGTIVDTWEIPANSTVGQSFPIPFTQTTANTQWTVQLSAAVTDVRIVAQFAINN